MTNCEWFDSKLEAYYCDALTNEELERFQGHLASCGECRQQVESLNSIDPLVRGVLEHRLALAQLAVHGNGHPRVMRLAAVTGAIAAAIILMIVGMKLLESPQLQPVATQPPPGVVIPVEPGIKKDETQETGVNLGKPLDGTPVHPVAQPQLDDARIDGPDFAIIDDAGYTATLQTYRGRVLLFAVISSEQKAALNNLEQIYEAFGANGRIGMLAVARHRKDDLRGVRVPLFFNNGSKLLGVQEGEFMLLDAAGKSRLKGSLTNSASLARVRTELAETSAR